MAAEYIIAGGNGNVVLCERGIRTFEPYTRNTLDLNAVPLIKRLSHLPVIVDPSHGTGDWRLVNPMAKAALAAGADGLIVEVHPCPEEALSDGCQSLSLANFEHLMLGLPALAAALGRSMTDTKQERGGDVMTQIVKPTKSLTGIISVPGDKSISHRSAMLSGLADTPVRITNFLAAEDCLSTVKCMEALGVTVDWVGPTDLVITGNGLYGLIEPKDVLDAGNSGHNHATFDRNSGRAGFFQRNDRRQLFAAATDGQDYCPVGENGLPDPRAGTIPLRSAGHPPGRGYSRD